MGWLGTWANRIKLTIDSDRIDQDLSNFPVLVTLASGVGQNSFDATNVFTSLEETVTIGTTYSTGDGSDGPLTVTGTYNINEAGGVAYKVGLNPTGTTIETGAVPSGIVAGDKILLINLEGTQTYYEDVGNYEFLTVAGVDGTTITTTTSIIKSYDSGDFNEQFVAIQRIPEYTNVTISGGGTLTASPYDHLSEPGNVGTGIVALFATGQVLLSSEVSAIDVTELGFEGGYAEASNSGQSPSGAGPYGPAEAVRGRWDSAGGGGYHNANATGGGGGAKLKKGGNGTIGTGSTYIIGYSGSIIDDIYVEKLFLTAGGSCGSSGGSGGISGHPAGVTGPGIVFIVANNVVLGGIIDASGTNGYNGSTLYQAGGGGTAGGTVFIQGSVAGALANILIDGGSGGSGGSSGGTGGTGDDGFYVVNELPASYRRPTITTQFTDNFTDGTLSNWEIVGGTPYYNWGYLRYISTGNTFRTVSDIDFGDNWEISFMMVNNWRGSGADQTYVQLCYDVATTYRQMRVYHRAYSAGDNYISFAGVDATGTSVYYTSNKYNYYNDYGKWFHIRIRRISNKMYFKVWRYDEDEPVAWDWEGSCLLDVPDSGRIYFNGFSDANNGAGLDAIKLYIYESNQKKIAITTSNGTTQCPVEIEYWNQLDQEAYLWTKIPTIASGIDTNFYLYYDINKLDNSLWVGETGTAPAISTWASTGYDLVYHMNQDPLAAQFKSSTGTNHAVPFSFAYSDLQDGLTGQSYYFPGDPTAKYLELTFNFGNIFTVEVFAYNDFDTSAYPQIFGREKNIAWSMRPDEGQVLYLGNGTTWDTGWDISNTYPPADEWFYAAVRDNAGTISYRLNDMNDGGGAYNSRSINTQIHVGRRNDPVSSEYEFDGKIQEFRIAKEIKSDSWLKASNYSLFDDLMVFSGPYPAPLYYYHGYITERGVPVERTVRLYYRLTGALMDETTSSGNGYYYLTTTISGEHFVIAFDDNAGEDYNAVVLDRLPPLGIE